MQIDYGMHEMYEVTSVEHHVCEDSTAAQGGIVVLQLRSLLAKNISKYYLIR
jgi:hypothetical protein